MLSIIRQVWAGVRAGCASDRTAAGDDARGHSRGLAGRRSRRRRRATGPVLEPLEGRALLSHFAHHAGERLTHTEIQPGLLGPARAASPDAVPTRHQAEGGPAATSQNRGYGDTLVLQPGTSIRGPGGSAVHDAGYGYTLVMQGDGNLVEYRSDGRVIWNTATYGNPGAYAVMQGDGNLVVYSAGHQPLWNSHTYGNPGAFLALLSTGDLAIFASNGLPLWSNEGMEPGEVLYPGPSIDPNACMQIDSPGGQYTLVMQGDGNLVEYGPGGAVWNSATYGHPGAHAIMQGDGNLVVYASNGQALWDSHTYGNPGAFLTIADNGLLTIYNAYGQPIWQAP